MHTQEEEEELWASNLKMGNMTVAMPLLGVVFYPSARTRNILHVHKI